MINTKEASAVSNKVWKEYMQPTLEAIQEQPNLIKNTKWLKDTYDIQFENQKGNAFGEALVVGFMDYLAKELIKVEHH